MIKRSDKRKPDQLRKINVQRKFMKYAEGSCLIEMGQTKVVCTASLEKNVPLFLRNSGTGWVTAEYGMLPRSTQVRIVRDKVSGRRMEIQRLIGRSLRSVVDLKKLGERTIKIDCDVIQADGGTRTASIIGGFIALVDCLERLRKGGVINEISVTDFLGAVSVGIFSGKHILDLTFQEDSAADVDMNVVMKGTGEFIEIQGTAEQRSFSQDDLGALLNLGKKGIEDIIDIERNLFKGILVL
ncbi:MAG: ribonuclease PH [Candidatus Omnitrophota bacterium]|nr:MAG: ribonuclease PH [Candidatus Omnitrophota bacterium]